MPEPGSSPTPRTLRVLIASAAAALVAWTIPASATAATIVISPGQNALGRAINRANPGDTIRMHDGRYREHVTVDKRLRIVAAPGEPSRPVVDARCAARHTIAVRHNGVVLKGLRVVGSDEGFGVSPGSVDFSNVSGLGRVEDLVTVDTCNSEYGVNVFNSGPIQVVDSRARGFSDAGFYVGLISDTGTGALRVRGNVALGNNRGIIVENSIASTNIRVTDNTSHNNLSPGEGLPSGIFLHDGDGIYIAGNTLDDNGQYGIHLDSNSSSNVLSGNSAHGNGLFDLRNNGSSNCFGNSNSFGSTTGNPLLPCP